MAICKALKLFLTIFVLATITSFIIPACNGTPPLPSPVPPLTFAVRVTVLTEDGKPRLGAEVTLDIPTLSDPPFSETTTEQGYAYFDIPRSLDGRSAEVTVKSSGFQETIKTFVLNPDRAQIEIRVKADPTPTPTATSTPIYTLTPNNEVTSTPTSTPAVITGNNIFDIKFLNKVKAHNGEPVLDLSFRNDGCLASIGGDGQVRLWYNRTIPLKKPNLTYGAVEFRPRSEQLAFGGSLEQIDVLDLSTQGLNILERNDDDWTVDLSFSPDGRRLAVSDGVDITIWNVDTGVPFTPSLITGGPAKVAFSHSGEWLASASVESGVRIWNALTLSTQSICTVRNSVGATSLTISPDDSLISFGKRDGTIALADPLQCQTSETWMGHSQEVSSLSFGADGVLLLSGDGSGEIRVWPVEFPYSSFRVLEGHLGAVWAIMLSPDRRLIASAGDDGYVSFWGLDETLDIQESISCLEH